MEQFERLDIVLQNGVKNFVFRVPYFPLLIFKILATKWLRELLSIDCLFNLHVSFGVVESSKDQVSFHEGLEDSVLWVKVFEKSSAQVTHKS
ncbi:hypothetical protein H5410_049011 [Solanum commersonii]|uniref:Uncharacterized protein n=1 Tax=Solanum commersonii TaxID=4109 RepID=A0A9J5XJW1_SOLCO|nr:hypothetical protein H5410_049011 [Solanum commersonii]